MDLFASDDKLKSLISKIDSKIAAAEYYEANQISRTLQFRCLNQKQYKYAILVTYYGGMQLLKNKQYKSGLDLSKLLLDLVQKYPDVCSDLKYEFLKELISLMDHSDEETNEFIARCIKYTSNDTNQNGDPKFHQILTDIYLSIGNDHLANVHMIQSKDGHFSCDTLLKLIHKYGDSNDFDLIICQALLQSCCIKDNLLIADKMFVEFTNKHPSINGKYPFNQPLLNFCHFFIITLREKNHKLFKTIVQLYTPSLSRDKFLMEYIKRIEDIYFPGPVSSSSNFFSMIGDLIRNSSHLNELSNSNNSSNVSTSSYVDNTELD